jgi:hypothetical protein
MITHNDQLRLFELIAHSLEQDVTCYAFGGTAMMFYGYKDETKDIDVLFEEEKERKEFIRIISRLGFAEKSPFKIYIPEKLRDKHRPLMYARDDYRFDLFVSCIFKTKLSPQMKDDAYAVHEFKGEKTLIVHVLRKEHLVMLKAVTERQNDFDDIKTIVTKEKQFDWNYLIDETLWQGSHGDTWVVLDVEKMLKELQEYVFVEEKWVKKLYGGGNK